MFVLSGKSKRFIASVAAACTIAVFLPSSSLAGESDIVPDLSLKSALIAAGADTNADGQLTEEELAALSGTLELSTLGITDLTGIQYATGITGLDVSGNAIRDISSISALALESINVSRNYLDISEGSDDMIVIDAFLGNPACTVTYEPQKTEVTRISLDKEQADIFIGDTLSLTASFSPEDADDKIAEWVSSDDSVATVDSSGTVTAVSNGSATITAQWIYDSAVTAECSITVLCHASGISLDKYSLSMLTGDTAIIAANVSPSDAFDKTVLWSSDNEAVATVDDGTVTALSPGTANIKAAAQDGGFDAVCVVSVKQGRLVSSAFTLDGGTVKGVGKATVLDIFKSSFGNDFADLSVYTASGEVYPKGILGTGMKVKLTIDGKVCDESTVIVSGDVNGDGCITISDYTLARLDILGLKSLTGVYKEAADVNGDGSVTISDYTMMRLDILGLKAIGGARPELPKVADPTIHKFLDIALAQIGDPYVGGEEGPDAFDCSGFIYYCLKQAGYKGTLWRARAETYAAWASWDYVDKADLEPGDLMFYFSDENPGVIGHVGIYLGNGYHIHASSDNGYIVICRIVDWYAEKLSHGRRVFR